MKLVYRIFAWAIAALVVVQAAAIAFAVFGLTAWIDNGGTLDKAGMESDAISFTGVAGFAVHGIAGTMVIPAVALLFLVVSFFSRVSRGVVWAFGVFVAVVAQVLLGLFAHGAPALGILHGTLALVLFGLALWAGLRVSRVRVADRVPAAVPVPSA